MSEPCKYEKEIGVLIETIKRHEKALSGNGQKGLVRLVDELNIKLERDNNERQMLTKLMDDLRTVVSGFNRFQIEAEVQVREEEKVKSEKRIKIKNVQWLIGILAMLIFYAIEKLLL